MTGTVTIESNNALLVTNNAPLRTIHTLPLAIAAMLGVAA